MRYKTRLRYQVMKSLLQGYGSQTLIEISQRIRAPKSSVFYQLHRLIQDNFVIKINRFWTLVSQLQFRTIALNLKKQASKISSNVLTSEQVRMSLFWLFNG